MFKFIKNLFKPSEKSVGTVGVAPVVDVAENPESIMPNLVTLAREEIDAMKREIEIELTQLNATYRHVMHEIDMYRETLVQLNASKQLAQKSLDFNIADSYQSEIASTERLISVRVQTVTEIKEKVLTLEAEMCNISNM